MPFTDDPRYITPQECEALFARITELAGNTGDTTVGFTSQWTGNLRWAANRPITSGDRRDMSVRITRRVQGARGDSSTNKLDDESLRFAIETAERAMLYRPREREPEALLGPQKYAAPPIWSEASYRLDARSRSAVGEPLVAASARRGFESAGYVETSAHARAVFNSNGLRAYYRATEVQCSVTVRAPDAGAFGWAGCSDSDWRRINADALTVRALHKCETSFNPRAIEPGRYTVILEPQAVHSLVEPIIGAMDRPSAENFTTPFTLRRGQSRIGTRMFDERVTISTDPMDPRCGYIPFDWEGTPYRPAKWVDRGVLAALPYPKEYGITKLGLDAALPNPFAFSMSGGNASIEEMIANTPRGLLITRFDDVSVIDGLSFMTIGTTRDGVWLIERGKIVTPVKNLRFNDSPLFALNRIEQLGKPERVLSYSPAVVPPLMIRDFNFNSLADVL